MRTIALQEDFAVDGLKNMSGGGPTFAVVDNRLAAESVIRARRHNLVSAVHPVH